MNRLIRNERFLKKVLWLDALLGGSTGLIGLLFASSLTRFLGFSTSLILGISSITFGYAVVAFVLVRQKPTSVRLLTVLVGANWTWAVISVVLFFLHWTWATSWGVLFLALQPLVVGGLAFVEGNQIEKANR
ncbi:hypothetical protein GCM10027299_02520 [Larkinella ripae]